MLIVIKMKNILKILLLSILVLAGSSMQAQEYAKTRHKKGKPSVKKETIQKEEELKRDKPKTAEVQPDAVKPTPAEEDEFIRLMNAAAKSVSRKQYADALGLYNRAMTFNRETARVLRCRGAAYFGLEDYLSSVNDYTKAIELNTDYPGEVYYSRAMSKAKMAEPDRIGACADFKKARELGFDIDTDKMIEEYCD